MEYFVRAPECRVYHLNPKNTVPLVVNDLYPMNPRPLGDVSLNQEIEQKTVSCFTGLTLRTV